MHHTLIPLVLALFTAIPTIAAAAGSVLLPASGQTACYDSAGTPRACAGSGEDGETRAGVVWPAPRFVANGEAALTDQLTSLIWSRHANAPDINASAPFVCGVNAESDMSWQQALDFIACLNSNSYAGFSDWRLPNLNELEGMVNAGAPDPSGYLSANGFGLEGLATLVQPSGYWSSTSDASFPDAAWDVNFLTGGLPFSSVKIPAVAGLDTRGVWPVRGVSSGAAPLAATGQTSCFSASGAEISCAGSGQDGEKLSGTPQPVPRFKANAEGSFALDRLTGLIWPTTSRTPGPANPAPQGCAAAGSALDWQQALDHTACLNRNSFLGTSGWRLPNRNEMRSLIDYSKSAPALAAGHPFSDLSFGDTYWSSTSDAGRPERAWTVNLFDGGLNATGKSNGGILSAWPVSGPDLLPPTVSITGGDLTVNVASRVIGGTMEAGSTVAVAVNGGVPAAAAVDGESWSFTVQGLTAGANAVTVTASDFSENQQSASLGITVLVPDGKLSGEAVVGIADALLALRMFVGLIVPTPDQLLRGDVSPLGAPDGEVGLADTLMILRKAVGLESF